MARILGIDPGVSGALVILDKPSGNYVDHLLMPTMKVGSSTRLNGAALDAWLDQHLPVAHAYLEKVNAMPGGGARKMGAAGAFTFGHAAGYVEGIVTGAGIPLTLVTPQSWKRQAGLIGQDKDAARARAIQLYPQLRALDTKAKGQAIADALLIALSGCQLLQAA